ncbi:hypothetical protein ACIBSV_36075 [Embleya sp. NPDC050154]|uniref:hypothetical protein n=1 Tax=Embleya sp. NPDC050154 TaxID=3363988 RepID=UPI0037BA12BA
MKFPKLAALAIGALMATSCAGGDDEPKALSTPAPGAATGGPGADPNPSTPASGLPRARSFEEIAALLKPTLGPCQRMETTGPATELDTADKVRGGKQKALCWYGGQKFSVVFLLVDEDNTTLETFHKGKDTYSGDRVGMGFTVRLLGTADAQVKSTAEQQLKAAGLLFLNCEQDFAPRDGVPIIEAKTTGCRYIPTFRI